jgi:hypothetical protein
MHLALRERERNIATSCDVAIPHMTLILKLT